VVRIEPSLQAAFLNYGPFRHGFLPLTDIQPQYYLKEKEEEERKGRPRIQDVLLPNQELLVQVEKEERNSKGASLTTYISLAGRYLILMPGEERVGISRKIEDEAQRERLRTVLEELNPPKGMGFIIRTAGIDRSKKELANDLSYLLRLWDSINKKCIELPAPSLVYQEHDLVTRTIRDYFIHDITEILIDDPDVYRKARAFFKTVMPRYERVVKLHKEKRPIFSKFNLEEQIKTIYERKVSLKSGGSIVIDPTEALVSIDVNSGKKKEKDIEETALKTNLEAAEEIARQLRLRDQGGLIVIDFIDMKDRKHNIEVEKRLKSALKKDKARIDMGRISKFGLLEISRQRIRPNISEASYVPCAYCQGKGSVRSNESLAISVLRRIQAGVAKGNISYVRGILPADVASYLLNQKKEELLRLEKEHDLKIHLTGLSGILPDKITLEFEQREIN
jgi:ribonuclease E